MPRLQLTALQKWQIGSNKVTRWRNRFCTHPTGPAQGMSEHMMTGVQTADPAQVVINMVAEVAQYWQIGSDRVTKWRIRF